MRRALLSVGTITFVAILALAPNARADDGGWVGSGFDTDPAGQVYTSAPTFSGTFFYKRCPTPLGCVPTRITLVSSDITLHDGTLPADCTIPTSESDNYDGARSSSANQTFSRTPDFTCNGVYDLAVHAHEDELGGGGDDFTLNATSITIAIPADAPKSVTAKVTDTGVAVSWVGPDLQQPDFLGYTVRRIDGTGHETVIVAGPTTSGSLVDKGVGGGDYTYAVRSMRAGAEPSRPTASSKVTIDGPPSSSSSSSSDSGSDSSSGPGGGSVVLGPAGGGVGGVTVVHVPTGRSNGATGGAGGATSGGGEGVLADEGFSTDLPYEPEPGELEAARPSVRTSDNQPGAALLIPGAVASVLFVWASLVLFVTRQARWADAGLLPVEVEYES